MAPAVPDLDRLFEHRGGFAMAVAKLRAYAIIVIKQRSGPTKNGRAVAKLDAQQLVVNALSRLTEMPSLDNGEEVYFQLRRHIDNEVHTLQKKKPDPTLLPIAVGEPEEGGVEVADPEDCNATDPSEGAERKAEDDFYRELLQELRTHYKPSSAENQLIGYVLQKRHERQEIARLIGISPEQYDATLKKVGRAAQALKETNLKKTAV